MVVVGGYALQRKDSDGLMSLISQICKKYNVINDEA